MSLLNESSILVNIKSSNGPVRCGGINQASAQPSNINFPAYPANTSGTKVWAGTNAIALLGQDCILPPGSYEVCVKFYKSRNGRDSLLLEKCRTFTIADKSQEICSPPVNINPVNDKTFTVKDISGPINFNWTPIVVQHQGPVIYHLVVWEVEEGQSNVQAMYSNLPIIEKDIKGITKFTALPLTFEKREATYVWRVIAVDAEGKPLCSSAKSEPTNFNVKIPETPVIQNSLNTPCGNGDFESGILDPNEWSAGYAKISGNNSTFSPPFNNIMKPANGNPVDAPLNTGCGNQANENHHVIVTQGTDPTIPTLNRVPPSVIANQYALRLGNNCPGCGTERIQKKFLVTPADTVYRFMYALVFQAPHSATDNPSLWVRVYNAANVALPGLVYLDPLNPAPMDRAISDPNNPYWKSYNSTLWRDWVTVTPNRPHSAISSPISQTCPRM